MTLPGLRRRRRAARRFILALIAAAAAQSVAAKSGAAQPSMPWRVASPPAATAWYATLDSLRLAGAGVLPLTRTPGTPSGLLGRTLAAERYDILHFVPLYYPSASRAALADALDDAAGEGAPRASRAEFVVQALRRSLPDPRDRRPLAELAILMRRIPASPVGEAQLAAWQAAWNTRFVPALEPFLLSERLDAGVLLVIPSLGAEGRVFTGLPADRADNLIAVGTPVGAADNDGPLYAAVRELCFPLISREAVASKEFRRTSVTTREAADRTSIAAVRCGAELLDRLLPAEAAPYRQHWRAVSRTPTSSFDSLYPADPILAPRLRGALQRVHP